MPKFHVTGGGVIEIDSWENMFVAEVVVPSARNRTAPVIRFDRPPGKDWDILGDQDYIQGENHVYKRYYARRDHYHYL